MHTSIHVEKSKDSRTHAPRETNKQTKRDIRTPTTASARSQNIFSIQNTGVFFFFFFFFILYCHGTKAAEPNFAVLIAHT